MTPSQQSAVERSGQDVCVVAGPGSGKTRVLIERFAWLVETRGISPSRILAITFTEKAAAEIKDRLASRLGASPELERAWVSTIDGFCARLLRENAIVAGLTPDFSVIEEAAAQRLAREAAEEALEEMYRADPASLRRLLESLDLATQEDGPNPDLARGLLDIYEAMRVSGVRELREPPVADVWPAAMERARQVLADRFVSGTGVAKLREWAEAFLALDPQLSREHFAQLDRLSAVPLNRISRNGPAAAAARELKNDLAPLLEQQWIAQWNAGLRGLLREAVARIALRYREQKRRDGVLDFADLEEEAIRLLEADEEVRRHTAARFDEVLMDELQDTNALQWRLAELISRRFFAVGDLNQSIYGFRHAEPAVFERYRDRLLREGFVIDELRENHRSSAAILEAVSRVLDGAPGIETREFVARRDGGLPVERMVAAGDEASEVEASMIATRLAELRASGRAWREIAILVRTLMAAQPIERALDRAGIPFVVSGGRTFLEAREIRDAMALLAALANPLDEVALIGVLRGPLAGLSDEEIFRLGREGWRAAFEERFGAVRARAGFVPPDLLLASALDQCGYSWRLGGRAQANLDKFLGMLRRDDRHRTLAAVVEEMEALRTLEAEAEAAPAEAGDLVRLMSMHAAKGLEFPVVFVSALHRGPDLRKPVIAFSATAGLGAKWRNPATGKGSSDTAHARIVAEMRSKDKEEENRLLYVAMTRAEDLLILSHAERGRGAWLDLVSKIPVTRAADQAEAPRLPPSIAQPLSEARFVDPPVFTGRFDSSVAATDIAAFAVCPRRFLLDSIDTAPRPESTGAVELGLEVHRVLAGGVGSAAAAALADRFHVSEFGRRAARATRVEREFGFLVPVGEIIVRGQIDLWFEESGELIVVDYKTDRDQTLSEKYAVQLNLYSLAIERYLKRPPERAILFYLRSNRTIDVPIDPPLAEQAVREFYNAQENIEFPMRPGERCRRCPHLGRDCPTQLSATEGGFEG